MSEVEGTAFRGVPEAQIAGRKRFVRRGVKPGRLKPALRRSVCDWALFSDAETAENAVEDIVGDGGPDDFSQVVDRLAKIDGDQLVATS